MLFKDSVFQRFARRRPIAVMGQMALGRLLDGPTVDRLFHENSEQQYERTLLFSSLTQLMCSVVLGKSPSVNASYKELQDKIKVSSNAVYEKLSRVEPGVCQSLVRHSYRQTLEIRKDLQGIGHHDLAGYRTLILDGNHLSKTEHRIKETRDLKAGPLPGKSLVVLDPRIDTIKDYFPIEDGHAQERSAIDPWLETIERHDLWIIDRNFCTLKPMYRMEARGSAFVIRLHGNLQGELRGKRRHVGECETGVIYEQSMELPAYEGQIMHVRRVEIELYKPTRGGDQQVVVLTNLPELQADALKVAELYRGRWKIETAFQKLTVTLNCEIKTLCYPKAALFAFALALVAYNAITIVQAAIAAKHGRHEADELSHYYLALELAKASDDLLVIIEPDFWLTMANAKTSKFNQWLLNVAGHVKLKAYRKSKRGVKKPPPKKRGNKHTVHVSTAQILAKRKKSAC